MLKTYSILHTHTNLTKIHLLFVCECLVIDLVLFLACFWLNCLCLDNHQEGVEQGEGFVDQVQDQGQEQEYLAEGKPSIHAYP